MEFNLLEKNIKDAIIEQQLKLGYAKETVGLYYPAESLKNILQCKQASEEELDKILNEFAVYVKPRYGEIGISHKKNRYCIKVSPIGSEYVHLNMGDVRFLTKLIAVVQEHDCTVDMIINVFREFSNEVVVEQMKDEDFDYMVCFADERMDEYRYCIKEEGCHMIYHRFTKSDYEELIR